VVTVYPTALTGIKLDEDAIGDMLDDDALDDVVP